MRRPRHVPGFLSGRESFPPTNRSITLTIVSGAMPLTQLLDTVTSTPSFLQVSNRLREGDRTFFVAGLAGSSLPLLVAHMHRIDQYPILVVVDRTETAEHVRDDLSSLLDETEVFLFPDWEVLPYDHLSPDNEVIGLRLQALDALRRRERVVVVASIRALMHKTLPPEILASSTIHIATADLVDFNELLDRYVRLGFERVDTVQVTGQFSVRGGIIDVFPYGTLKPFRIEFFGDEVESIRTFDPYTQRSTEQVQKMTILPHREIVIDASAIEDAVLRVLIKAEAHSLDGNEVAAQIQNDGYFDGIERYLPFYHPDATTILSYFPTDALVCLCEPSRLREEAAAFLSEIEDTYTATLDAGDVVPKPADLFEPFAPWLDRLSSYRVAHLIHSSDDAPSWCDIGAVNTGVFHGALDILRTRLAEWREQQATILVVCDNQGQADRLNEILGPDADEVSMIIGTLHAGFVITGVPIVVLTDAEIFSRYRQRRRRPVFKEGVVIEDFTSIVEGDYIVHIDHGIGKYLGLKQLSVDGRERDCLTISYAEEDRLYIPIEQLHRVQKYIGADGEVPSLSRLGGKSWEQLKARTKKAVQDIAQDLVRLYAARQSKPGFSFSTDTLWQRELEDSFIYEETPDQLKSTMEIKQDMERATPMDRLVCGDVGYGKTEVAIRAAFKAVMDSKQVAILVPTTILAQQHFVTFSERMADYPVNIRMLSRFVPPREQKRIREGLKQGEVDLVIGTHRLIQRDVEFNDLGLVIVDEEQRFGVTHKERLKQLKQTVDVMAMTATPIPRTLHMSLVGARDMSVINTPPRDRFPVHTEVVRFDEEIIREAILREVDRGGQVYFVHNRVQSIDAVLFFLERLLPQVSFVVGHGQMAERDLERVMIDFMDRKYDCLVSTMIIESGLDIPNVNTILINRADRFGLAQLYQLRGRVGRSNHRAYAYLMIPTSAMITSDARKRLTVIAEYTALGSGFHIAMRDLEIRGAGNLLGPQQHGFMAAVGFDLYCRLLQEAVQELKGETVDEGPEPTVDLRADAFIPDTYIADRKLKVGFYQRLSQMTREDQVETVRDEMRDRFGRLPDPTCVLLDLVSIKLLAKAARLKSITVRDRGLVLTYPEGKYPTKTQIAEITCDRSLDIEFPHGATFLIKIRLTGTTDAVQVELAKKLLQKLV